MEHSFSIKDIRLNESHFSMNKTFKLDKDKKIEIINNIEIKYRKAGKSLDVVVMVSSDSENQPFRFSVAWEGLFAFKKMPSKSELERIAHINCAAIIFPFVRETVADLTRRASMRPLNLPPFNFVAIYNEKQKTGTKATPKKPLKMGSGNAGKKRNSGGMEGIH